MVLPFPHGFLSQISGGMYGGMTVNGDSPPVSPFAPKPGQKTY